MRSLALAIALAAPAAPAAADPATRAALAAAMAADLPVVAAARDRDGAIDVESRLTVDDDGADAIVDIGSITKTVTAIATLHLIEAGDLATTTTLGAVLRGAPADKADITVHQLLTHTSGVVESVGDDDEPLTRDAFLARVFATPLDAPPGARHGYSNAGYSILAAIIELRSGLRYEDYLIDRVIPVGIAPIGYARAYDAERSIVSGRSFSTGFQRRRVAGASWGGDAPGWNLVGNGGAVATAEGLVRFLTAFLDGRIVGDEQVRAALAPHVDEGGGDTFYGYGVVVEPLGDGDFLYGHDGGNDVFSAEWRHATRAGVTWVTAGRGDAAFDAMRVIAAAGPRR